MMLSFALFTLLLGSTVGFTDYQNRILRAQMINHKAPPLSGIVDAVLASDYAFTDQQRLLVHIDAARFECCPNSFANVVIHEIHHLHQRQHNIAPAQDDPMSYRLTTHANGDVVEDNFILPPLNSAQSWALPILKPAAVPVTRIAPADRAALPTRSVTAIIRRGDTVL